jgi:uncharacterized protein YbjT (DUF2867 family)
MKILVVGGTGTAGRPTVAELVRRGHSVLVLSRSGRGADRAVGVRGDVTTGAGLAGAMDGVDAVVDTTNVTTLNGKEASAFFTGTTRRLVAAEAAAGVGRHVLLSIVGIERVPSGYYRAKLAQERALAESADAAGVRWSVQRATQFHEFAAQMIGMLRRGPLVPMPIAALQPVSTLDVAAALADAVENPAASGRLPDLAGPEPWQLTHMARAVLAARGERAVVVPLPLPGGTGRGMRAGGLRPAPGTPTRIGRVTFEDYLATLRATAAAASTPRT